MPALRPYSLRAYLAFMIFLLVLIPASIVIVLAFSHAHELIAAERIGSVGRVSDARHEELVRILKRSIQRGERSLEEIYRHCGKLETHSACYQENLKVPLASEQALGIMLWGPDGQFVGEGDFPDTAMHPPVFKPGQLAKFTPFENGFLASYLVVAHMPGTEYHLGIRYPIKNVQSVFTLQPELGKSGETFLADGQGYFITSARYPSIQGHGVDPISAVPMKRCLTPENGETLDLDYRNVPIIHGFRFVPEIGAGCIMSHIDQAEAFAPLSLLRRATVIALAVLLLIAVTASYVLARWVVKPVVKMKEDIVHFTQHGDAVASGTGSYREVQELYDAFHALTLQLRHSKSETDVLMKQLDEQANTDKLTGAWNRRHLEAAVKTEMERMSRYGTPVSMFIFDLDFFKKVNDTWGHATGDRVLKDIVALSKIGLRSNDSVSRWGGEEFVVLCPNTDATTVLGIAERLRELVAQTAFADVGHITVSMGVAECRSGEPWQDWFRRADKALYSAKNSGRNQVQLAL